MSTKKVAVSTILPSAKRKVGQSDEPSPVPPGTPTEREDVPKSTKEAESLTRVNESKRISGRVISLLPGQPRKKCVLDDGKKDHYCEVDFDVFLEMDDILIFEPSEQYVPTRGNNKGKIVYVITKDTPHTINIPTSEEAIHKAFRRVPGKIYMADAKFDEFQEEAEREGITICEFLYQSLIHI